MNVWGGSTKSFKSTIRPPWTSVSNVIDIYSIHFEIFESGPKWWTDQPTNAVAFPSYLEMSRDSPEVTG